MKALSVVGLLLMLPITAQLNASETLIEGAKSVRQSDGNYQFSVTLRHADKSWDHYANFWQVQGEDGKVYAKRVLHHPHINEQPFTRSLNNVKLPKNTKKVIIVAGCNVDGANSKKFLLKLN
jgi:hypothetical protein